MLIIYIDADACPVKEEIYNVAARYSMKVVVVAQAIMRVRAAESITLKVCPGFGVVDDWIAEQIGPGDLAVTADIPLAARCLAKGAHVLDPKGNPFTDKNIGQALGMRDLKEHLRQGGGITGGPGAMTRKDRSRFLAKLDELLSGLRRAHVVE